MKSEIEWIPYREQKPTEHGEYLVIMDANCSEEFNYCGDVQIATFYEVDDIIFGDKLWLKETLFITPSYTDPDGHSSFFRIKEAGFYREISNAKLIRGIEHIAYWAKLPELPDRFHSNQNLNIQQMMDSIKDRVKTKGN